MSLRPELLEQLEIKYASLMCLNQKLNVLVRHAQAQLYDCIKHVHPDHNVVQYTASQRSTRSAAHGLPLFHAMHPRKYAQDTPCHTPCDVEHARQTEVLAPSKCQTQPPPLHSLTMLSVGASTVLPASCLPGAYCHYPAAPRCSRRHDNPAS